MFFVGIGGSSKRRCWLGGGSGNGQSHLGRCTRLPSLTEQRCEGSLLFGSRPKGGHWQGPPGDVAVMEREQWYENGLMRRHGVVIGALVTSGLVAACFVRGKSGRSSDDRSRSCVRDDDCRLSERCVDQVCQTAEGCSACSSVPHGQATCFHGQCLVEVCSEGWHDANGLYQDGCEYACEVAGVEQCNEVDDDCDGLTDEDFNLSYDPDHCGACGHPCPAPAHADPLCSGGTCYFQCQQGFYDNDGDPSNGCEAQSCQVSAGGQEICDLRDNDCDGLTDEGVTKDDPHSCGPLCADCSYEGAQGLCVDGGCVMGDCLPGHFDLDRSPGNGCEYPCVPTGDEVCDGQDDDCNGLTDEGLVCHCPEGMVSVDSIFCIDRYEASRPDATASSEGSDDSFALSRPGVMPWDHASTAQASAACQAVGKRLCTPAEWERVCRGPDDHEYCYGDQYDPTVCNGIDLFCRCGSGSVCEAQDPCPFPHCYGQCGAFFHLLPTGSLPNCTNGYGVLDINGNVWERVQGGTARGGAFNCGDSEALHRCDYVADWGPNDVGFRCCCTDCPKE